MKNMSLWRLPALIWALIPVLAAVVAPTASAADAASTRVYSFGVVPQQAASKLARAWAPLLDHLGRQTGITLRFRTAPDIPTFERRVAAGEYDFSYMNPYHYTVFSAEPGYRAFAKARGKRIKGILVVAKDSGVATMAGLSGETLAFPAPAAFAASILTQAGLKQAGVTFEPRYVRSHDSVYRAVAKGLYPAGGGVVRTLKALDPAVAAQLRILWTTPGYTPHAFAAHPRVRDEVVERLAAGMVAIDADRDGRQLLTPLKVKGFEAAVDADWDDVRALGIELIEPASGR